MSSTRGKLRFSADGFDEVRQAFRFYMTTDGTKGQAVDDCRLFESAPALLAALRDALKQLDGMPYWIEQAGGSKSAQDGIRQTIIVGQAAINQATGV